jgi:hypothetical protein
MKNILHEANNLVNGDRKNSYGDAKLNFEHTAKVASLLTHKELTRLDIVKIMLAVKLSRESYKHKTDNLVDLCGYAQILENIQ